MSVVKTATGYQVRWYDADGVSRKETVRGIDRREAERIERVKLAERDRGELPLDERNAPTFRAFSETWISEGRGLGARRINLLLVVLKSILKVARRRRFLREDPLAAVRLLKEPRQDGGGRTSPPRFSPGHGPTSWPP